MKIDTKDIKFWMDAIRNSDDRDRTLESFWGGQLESKAWLVETVEQFRTFFKNQISEPGPCLIEVLF